jgi:hypothetical protein
MNRRQAAAWAGRGLGRRVDPALIRRWERVGALSSHRPGRSHRARFTACDLVRLRAVAALRLLRGEPLQRVARASQEIAALWPILAHGRDHVVVDRVGHVLFVAGGDAPEAWGPVLPLGSWAASAIDAAEEG